MRSAFKKLLGLAVAVPFALAVDAAALPSLQLGIDGGTYDGGSESTVTSDDTFTLNAYLSADEDVNTVSDTYYLSIAVVPSLGAGDGGDYGSFTINGVTIEVTGDMVYGTPPLDALYPDLGSHGVFETYYAEIAFSFDAEDLVSAFDVQDGSSSSGTMNYAAFDIDVSGLSAAGVELHFDLYNENLVTRERNVDYSIQFAPYSHDAETTNEVPEPATLLLLGSGLLGLGALRRRRG